MNKKTDQYTSGGNVVKVKDKKERLFDQDELEPY